MALILSPTPAAQRGFTLIEMLVAITIMLLLFGIGIVSYLRFDSRQQLIQAGEELKSDLRIAQARARTGDRPDGCDRLLAYEVAFTSDQTYEVREICEPPITSVRSEGVFKRGVRISAIPASPIAFRSVHGGVDNPQTFELVLDSSDLRWQVSVTAGGEISGGGFVGE